MVETDEPTTTTLLVLGAIGAGAASAEQQRKQASKASAARKQEAAALTADANKETAEPVEGLSEQAKRNRRLAVSQLTRRFAEPTLSEPALTGV